MVKNLAAKIEYKTVKYIESNMNAVGHALFDVTLGHLNYVEYVREVTDTYNELVLID